jgi:hypothetical protein
VCTCERLSFASLRVMIDNNHLTAQRRKVRVNQFAEIDHLEVVNGNE